MANTDLTKTKILIVEDDTFLLSLLEKKFKIERFFVTRDVPSGAPRGNHAHCKTSEVVFCIHGSCAMHLDDGATRQKIRIGNPAVGILHGPGVWHELSDFTHDCVLLVFSDTAAYNRSEYIFDYQEFLRSVRSRKLHKK